LNVRYARLYIVIISVLLFDIVNKTIRQALELTALASRGSPYKESTMTTSKQEYIAWINGGMCGTRWRADTIREAVENCIVLAAQDFPGMRGTEVPVAVFEVNEPGSRVLLAGALGTAFLCNTSGEKGTELPFLFLVKVDVPTLRKNGHANGRTYANRVENAADTALLNVIGN
jgi:hypothetical protein